MCRMRIEFCGHFRSFGDVTTVHQPKAGGNCSSEGDAVFHKG